MEDLGVDSRMKLQRILKRQGGGCEWTGSGQGPVVGSCEHGNEPFFALHEIRGNPWL